MTASRGLTGVLLMSFGTPSSPDEVPEYLARVRGGRPMSPEVVAEMQRRYRLIGGSPLTHLTREQAAALEARLNAHGDGAYRVVVGMRHAQPWIADALADLAADGAEQVVALVMSPQYSDVIMGGYLRAIDEARAAASPPRPHARRRTTGTPSRPSSTPWPSGSARRSMASPPQTATASPCC